MQYFLDALRNLFSPVAPSVATYPRLEAWLEFGARIVEASWWPGVLLTVVLLFRREIKSVIDNLEHAKVGQLEFRRAVKKSMEIARTIQPEPYEPSSAEDTRASSQIELAETSPLEAIFEAYRGAEAALLNFAQRAVLTLPDGERGTELKKLLQHSRPNPKIVALELKRLGLLDDKPANLFVTLSRARNTLVHQYPRLNAHETAKDYIRSTVVFRTVLRQIPVKLQEKVSEQ